MRKKLMIACPNCNGGNSQYYREIGVSCSYCKGAKEIDILEHQKNLGVTDERNANVKSFISDPRFMEYLIAKHG